MKTGRKRFRIILIWIGGLFITGSTIIFLINIDSYWIPAAIGFIFMLVVIVYFVSGGFTGE